MRPDSSGSATVRLPHAERPVCAGRASASDSRPSRSATAAPDTSSIGNTPPPGTRRVMGEPRGRLRGATAQRHGARGTVTHMKEMRSAMCGSSMADFIMPAVSFTFLETSAMSFTDSAACEDAAAGVGRVAGTREGGGGRGRGRESRCVVARRTEYSWRGRQPRVRPTHRARAHWQRRTKHGASAGRGGWAWLAGVRAP